MVIKKMYMFYEFNVLDLVCEWQTARAGAEQPRSKEQGKAKNKKIKNKNNTCIVTCMIFHSVFNLSACRIDFTNHCYQLHLHKGQKREGKIIWKQKKCADSITVKILAISFISLSFFWRWSSEMSIGPRRIVEDIGKGTARKKAERESDKNERRPRKRKVETQRKQRGWTAKERTREVGMAVEWRRRKSTKWKRLRRTRRYKHVETQRKPPAKTGNERS